MDEDRQSLALENTLVMRLDVTYQTQSICDKGNYALSWCFNIVSHDRSFNKASMVTRLNQSVSFLPPALPLQTESQSIQNGDKSLGKDILTSDDSAVTDLSLKTDSSPITETPTNTDASCKTDVRPSTPGSSPQPKKGRHGGFC